MTFVPSRPPRRRPALSTSTASTGSADAPGPASRTDTWPGREVYRSASDRWNACGVVPELGLQHRRDRVGEDVAAHRLAAHEVEALDVSLERRRASRSCRRRARACCSLAYSLPRIVHPQVRAARAAAARRAGDGSPPRPSRPRGRARSASRSAARSFGSAAGGAVATAHARPSRPRVASRRPCGSDPASFGSTRESGDSGMPNSPTPVFSAKRPATFSSESSVAAVTEPVRCEISLKDTDAESAGGDVLDALAGLVVEARAADVLREQVHADEVRRRRPRCS